MRSPARRPLQALLAADLLTTGPAEPLDVPGASGGLALCSSAAVAATVPAGVTTVLIGPGRWQGLLGELVPRLVDVEVLVEAQRRAMKWAVTRRGAFAWVAGPATPARHPVPPNRVPVATTERVAELTLAVLHRDVVAGRLRGGDRVTESYLARGTHASRGQVRDALRVLAGRGVVDLQPNRGAVVPVPGVEDVVETYAARSALGAVIVRRVADSYRPGQIERLEAALQSMLATAGTGDAWATGEDDLRFQEVLGELAATAGMRRVPGMFAALTAQLRMMIAVLGLRYAYSVGDMCADDADLLELIRQRRGAAAAGRWNRKMADAAAYMIEQLRKRETP